MVRDYFTDTEAFTHLFTAARTDKGSLIFDKCQMPWLSWHAGAAAGTTVADYAAGAQSVKDAIDPVFARIYQQPFGTSAPCGQKRKYVILTFEHEPNGAGAPDAATLKAAWRMVANRMALAKNNADSSVDLIMFVPIQTAWSYNATNPTYGQQWWPSAAYVDGIAEDAYNWAGWKSANTFKAQNWEELTTAIQGMLDFSAKIEGGAAAGLPGMIGETSSSPWGDVTCSPNNTYYSVKSGYAYDPVRKANYFRNAAAYLRNNTDNVTHVSFFSGQESDNLQQLSLKSQAGTDCRAPDAWPGERDAFASMP